LADYNSDFLNGDFEAGLDSLSQNETYYLYCRTGNRSGQAAEMMKQRGFKRVYNVGGFQELVNSGFESVE
ncbi:MAG: rhodanese-like domain-containing protein, partial [Candidatus Halalkalibacterium sp. M3_1C_030]